MEGLRFGDYLLETRIAAGGMGEVWRARDVNLNRPVAIKLLSRALASDPEFIARFVREAQTAAGLSHPAIATIYAVGEAHGRHYLAMELLPGETLDQRMARERLTPAKALSIAAQMADGLAAAHARGLVHRDIKPGNLMVLPDGRLKVLDFGLAKPETGALGGDATDGQAATRALAEGVTAAGVILGTVAYMSPEQARGEPLDRRSDIFSAGVVLYELLSGRHPYRASSAAQTLANLLHLRPSLPPIEAASADSAELARITAKCLAQDREERYQHADELAVDLRAARRQFDDSSGSRALTQATAATAAYGGRRSRLKNFLRKPPGGRSWLWGIAGVAAGFALTVAVFGIFGHGGRFLRSERPDVALVTRDATVQEAARLSPDGLSLVYQSDRAGPLKIFARGVGSTQTVQLTQGDDADTHPLYSPDGATIAYQRERRLDHGLEIRLVPALGGNSRKLFEGARLQGFYPDGKALLVAWCGKPCGLYRLSVEGGTPELALELTGADYDELRAAALTPDRQYLHFVLNDFAERRGGLWEVELRKGAKPERLVPFRNDFGTAIGYGRKARRIYFSACNQQSSYANIYYYDRVAKQVRPVTGGANINIYPALSADGRQLVYTNWNESDQIGVLPLTGMLAGPLPLGGGWIAMISHGRLDDEQPAFSPDGGELAYVSDADGNYNLWIASLPSGERRQLSFGKDANFSPLYSRDGKEVFYYSNHGGKTALYRISTSGGQPRLLSDQTALPAYLSYAASPSLSPDGLSLLLGSPLPEGGFRVTRVEIVSGKAAAIGGATGMAPVYSADGKSIYAISRGPAAQERGDAAPFALWRYTPEGKAEKLHDFAEPVLDRYLAATADGKYLYYLAETFPGSRERQVWRIALDTLTTEQVTHLASPHPRFGLAVSRDGSRLALSLNRVDANIVMLDGMGD